MGKRNRNGDNAILTPANSPGFAMYVVLKKVGFGLFKEDMMFPDRIRIFNKYVTNRILRGFAYASRGPFAIIRHAGRRSGKPYETVIMVWPLGGGFVIALTYGPKVDWYRNILAAGGGTVLWHKRVYAVRKPESIDAETALPAFPAPFRPILRMQGVQHFVWVKSSGSEPVRA